MFVDTNKFDIGGAPQFAQSRSVDANAHHAICGLVTFPAWDGDDDLRRVPGVVDAAFFELPPAVRHS
jgi:hypothetical protein